MPFDLKSISSARRVRAPRIVLLGTAGIGKSEFAAGADNAIFIPVKGEDGIDALDVQAFPPVESYRDVMDAVGTLYAEPNEFKTVVLDSSSALAPLVDVRAIEVEGAKSKASLGGGYGHQWDTILSLWRDLMEGLDALRNERNMTIVVIGHVKIKASRDPESESFDQWVYDIDQKIGDSIVRWSDATLFMSRKTVIKKTDDNGKKEKRAIEINGGQRYLWTQGSPTHPGKARGAFGDLPAEIALPRKGAWGVFMDEVAKAHQQKE